MACDTIVRNKPLQSLFRNEPRLELTKPIETSQVSGFIFTARKTKLREGNVFTGVCQSFCRQGRVTKFSFSGGGYSRPTDIPCAKSLPNFHWGGGVVQHRYSLTHYVCEIGISSDKFQRSLMWNDENSNKHEPYDTLTFNSGPTYKIVLQAFWQA